MESFIVSARKYRPAIFDEVVGQKSITNTLKNAIKNNHIAQSFLFCGPRGVGKTTCARILAKTINCANITENIEPCNKCESCISFNKSASFNIHELDAASNNSVDDIRNLVDKVRIPPQVGNYKVYIIDEVHMLSLAAFNTFLKTLEEPPSYAKFILATTEKHKIIPTILSRCQIFDFKRISVDDITKYLEYVAEKEKVKAEHNALHIIAQKADGAMRDALSIFDQIVSFSGNNITYQTVIENLNVLDYEYYFRMVDMLLDKDITNALLLVNEVIENGFDGQHFLIGLGEHLRNLLVSKDKATIKLLEVSDDFREKYKNQSEKTDTGFLLKAIEINSRCDIDYKSSNNKRLLLELAIMHMCNVDTEAEPSKPSKKSSLAQPQKKTKPAGEPAVSYKKPQEPTPKKDEAPKHETQKPYSFSSTGTISIKDAGNSYTAKEKEDKEKRNQNSFKPADEFTTEQLIRAWKDYAESISEKTPSFSSAMLKYEPVPEDDFTVIFKTDNKIIANDRTNLQSLLGHLKKELNNYKIKLDTEVTKKAENNKAYTDKEKFDLMAKKNPNIKKLKNDLNLEIDF